MKRLLGNGDWGTTLPSPASSASLTGLLSALLERTKPYREIITILIAVAASVSACVAWVVAHFATQKELHYVECRVTSAILTQLLPVRLEEFAGKIEWRNSQIKVLATHGGGTAESVATIRDLSDEVTALTKEQEEAAKKMQADIDAISGKCISEAPQASGTP